jgi:hypothetical protein
LMPLAEKLLEVPIDLVRAALDLETSEGTVIADSRRGSVRRCGPRMPVTLYTTAAAAVRPTRDEQRLATSPNPRGLLPIDPVTRTG